MKNNKLLISIIILSIIIVIISVVLFMNNKQDKTNIIENSDNNKEPINDIDLQEENNKAQNISPEFSNDISFQEYFTVCNCIKKGLNEQDIFTPISIKKYNSGNVVNYAASGLLLNSDMNYLRDINYLVKLDTKNLTFLIEETDNIDSSKLSNEKIENRENNSFVYQEVTDQYRFKQVFYNMKYLILAKPEIVYNYLEKEYKEKRFGKYENFISYINKNREHIKKIIPKSYKIGEDIRNVKIRDQYENWYEFNITGVLEYNAKIDNYILLFDDDIIKYNKYDEKQKINYNIQRWINMLNNKEYGFAYNFLDETFKNNNYETLEKFSQFMQSKYPDSYDIVEGKVKENGSVYTTEIQLSVKDDEYADKYMTIIMKLKEGTDFVLSFDAQ